MHPSKFSSQWIILIISIGLLTGCESLLPGTENIQLTKFHPPSSCQFRGDVDSGVAKARLVSHQKIEEMQIVTLKNQALKLGGNVIEIPQHETTYYLPYVPPRFPLTPELKTHRMQGRTYHCDEKAMRWFALHPSSVSDVCTNCKFHLIETHSFFM
jgi:hypothetical protein